MDGNDTVGVYTQKGHLLIDAFSTFLADGVAIDSKRTIYVAADCGIEVYPAPWTASTECLSTGGGSAVGVAVNHVGLVAAMVNNASRAAEVVLFAPGSQSGCRAVTGSGFVNLSGRGSFDSKDNLYVIGTGLVGEVSGGCRARRISDLNLTGVSTAGGVRIDSVGNIDVLVQSGSADAINIYPPGSKSPSGTVPIESGAGSADFVFTNSGKNVWTAGYPAYEYAFPAGGSPILPGIYFGAISLAAYPVLNPGPR